MAGAGKHGRQTFPGCRGPRLSRCRVFGALGSSERIERRPGRTLILETPAPLHVPFRPAMPIALMHDEWRDAERKQA